VIDNVCACCLKPITDYPGKTVYCSECRAMRRRVMRLDQFSLIRIIETSRTDIEVRKKSNDRN